MRPKIRCAIYTRKSTEEGLEQDFNSLDAQYEACAAYIVSQKAEGWRQVSKRYDDGGLSGGTMQRPALQQLLADIAAGHIDRIVVYKIDRLTRSLSDFAKIVDQLDAMEASFVSVTQSFNTATSMGRLTLNMLLSFAQFEREVTAERIRDKIAASKRKGLWMGGTLPLGYDKDRRTLAIIPSEATLITRIYADYLRLGSIGRVKEGLDLDSCTTRINIGKDGQPRGGKPFTKTHLHALLTSPIYAGKIKHKDKIYDGQHPAIINQEMWDQVQDQLSKASARRRGAGNIAMPSPLAGKLFDATGDRLTPSHTVRCGKRVRYYVSRRLLVGSRAKHPDGWRLPAAQLEPALASLIVNWLADERTAQDLLFTRSAAEIRNLHDRLKEMADRIRADAVTDIWPQLIGRCDLGVGKIKVQFDQDALADASSTPSVSNSGGALTLIAPFHLRKRGFETKIVIGGQAGTIDLKLVQNIALGLYWYEAVISGATFKEIALSAKVDIKRIRQMIEFALLAPRAIEDILIGQQPIALTTEWLKHQDLPIGWVAQHALIASAN